MTFEIHEFFVRRVGGGHGGRHFDLRALAKTKKH